MKRWLGILCAVLLMGETNAAEAKRNTFWEEVGYQRGLQQGSERKEVWRKGWGKERSLLLYIDETETLQMCFTDGPWLYLTEEPVERIKAAGMARWAEEAETLK